jgi:peptidoglycan/xylan/chitin deacetylase (PgdA/CDA1 family)
MISRRSIRGLLDRSALLLGLTRLSESRMQQGFTVLMYHRVLPDAQALAYPFGSLAMPVSAFAAQVEWLAQHCEVQPLRECVRRAGELRSGRPLLAVTFDDGYEDNASAAAPLLEAEGLRATFYVTTDFVGQRRALWFDSLAGAHQRSSEIAVARAVESVTGLRGQRFETLASWMAFTKSRSHEEREALLLELAGDDPTGGSLEEREPMTLEQLRSLHAAGHEIGAHTLSHPILTQLDDDSLDRELRASKETLEGWLGEAVTGLAYPNGDHDTRVVDAARSVGFEYACTTAPGINISGGEPLTLSRIDVTRDRVFDAAGNFDPLAFRSEVCRVRRFMRTG